MKDNRFWYILFQFTAIQNLWKVLFILVHVRVQIWQIRLWLCCYPPLLTSDMPQTSVMLILYTFHEGTIYCTGWLQSKYLNTQICLWVSCCPFFYHWDNYVEQYFGHNAVASHFALLFHMQLHNNFLGQWIKCWGPVEWPALHLDLTTCDYVLWCWAKEELCQLKLRALDELEELIYCTYAPAPLDFLTKSAKPASSIFQWCIQNTRAYAEMEIWHYKVVYRL